LCFVDVSYLDGLMCKLSMYALFFPALFARCAAA
jgi:hypothetical protein